MLAELQRAHSALHAVFRYKPDEKPREKWDRPEMHDGKLEGDCEDFALEMDARARELGLPLDCRRLAICRADPRSKAQDHCVLVLEIGGERWISDCNEAHLRELARLPYDRWALSPKTGPMTADWELI